MATPRVHLPVIGVTTVPLLGDAGSDPLVDAFARRIRYLRVSVTDRCNYRCSYCMPEELGQDLSFATKSEVLTFEEIERIVSRFATLGVRKVRLTGGEPTVRKGIVELVARIRRIAGIEQVVMTTNGHLLDELAVPLAAAGLSAVNVSLDTLDAGRFRQLTGRGDLSRVLGGIVAARGAGLVVKTNAVALRGVNDDEVAALCEHAWAHDAVPRFIEHMPMSEGQLYATSAELSAVEIRTTIEARFGALAPAMGPDSPGSIASMTRGASRDAHPEGTGSPDSSLAGPARYWRTPAGREVGIISAMTEHFCDDCNRLRLTATGSLHACLGHDDAISLRDVLRAGGTDDDLTRAIASAVTGKRAGHVFDRQGGGAPAKHMIGIGG